MQPNMDTLHGHEVYIIAGELEGQSGRFLGLETLVGPTGKVATYVYLFDREELRIVRELLEHIQFAKDPFAED